MKKVSCSLRVLGIFAMLLFLIACGNGGGGDGGSNATLVSIAVTPSNPTISIGANQQFTATGTYSDAATKNITTSVTWSSSDAGAATISNATGSKGRATAMGAGSTTIKATLGDISGETVMTVTSTLTSPLPRTGQTSPLGVGDDGELQKGVAWPSPRFTAGSDAEANCITDNLTGLMWEKSPDINKRTWADALTYANDLDLCGHTDWRSPNKEEIRSLINYGEASSAVWLVEEGFSNVQADSYWYWSSTTYAGFTDWAWYFNMEDGNAGAPDKDGSSYVWAVRSGQGGVVNIRQTGQTESYAAGDDGDMEEGNAWPDPRFTEGTGTEADCITDNLTGLMWAKSSDTSATVWDDALAYANDSDLCVHTDWRLPNINELNSLVHAGESDTVSWLNEQGFNLDTTVIDYWTSTTYALNPGQAWYIGISDGFIGTVGKNDGDFFGYALLVRSVQ